MRIRFLLFLLFTTSFLALQAQDYKVVRPESRPLDFTAREHPKQDERGRQCAVFRIATQNISPEQRVGFHFGCDYGSWVVERQIVDGEIWVWVSPGLKTFIIKHTLLGTVELHTANCGITVEPLHTYKIVLVGTSNSSDSNIIAKQFLVFEVSPKAAILTVNGATWPLTDGVAQKMVDFGTYEYRIEAQDYHVATGTVDVYDSDNKVKVKKSLDPAFGFLKIEGDENILSKASVFIDNANGAEAMRTPKKLGSGQHVVRVLHPMYKPYEQTVVIKDNETNTLRVDLNANYANVTLKVDADAEIWVNGEKKGVRNWTGNLEAGSYILECRMKDHKATRMEQNITSEMSGETIELEVPKPLTGLLVLSSTPAIADIYIDGENKGETPIRINKIKVGKHTLRLEKKGYKPLSKVFTIEDGKTLELEETLEPEAVAEKPKKEAKPKVENPAQPEAKNTWFVTANAAYSLAPQPSFGFSVGQVKRFGWFLSVMTNGSFKGMSAAANCDAEGFLDDGSYPLYTGEKAKDRHSVIVGGVARLSSLLYARVGVGYGMRNLSWKDVNGQYYRNMGYSVSGVDLSVGLQMHIGKFAMSLEGVTTNFKTIEGKIGVGVAF